MAAPYFEVQGNAEKDRIIKIWIPVIRKWITIDKSIGGKIFDEGGHCIGYVTDDGYIKLNSEYRSSSSSLHNEHIPDYKGYGWE